MVATLIKEVEDAVVVVARNQEILVSENKVVFRGTADSIAGLCTAGMDSVCGKVPEDMVYP